MRFVAGEALETPSQSDLQTHHIYRLSYPIFYWQQLTGYVYGVISAFFTHVKKHKKKHKKKKTLN